MVAVGEKVGVGGGTGRGSGALGLGYMVMAVGAFSVIPLGVLFSGGSGSPFLFNCFLRLGGLVGVLIFLLGFHRRFVLSKANLRVVRDGILCWSEGRLVLIAGVSTGNFLLFALAVRFLDVAVVGVLYEMYPVVVIFVAGRCFRGTGLYGDFGGWNLLFVGLSIVGFLLAVVSQDEGFVEFLIQGAILDTALGVTLVLGSVLLTGLSVLGWRWGWNIRETFSDGIGSGSEALCGMVVALVLVNLLSCLVCGAVGVGLGESVDRKLVGFSLLTGLLGVGLGPVCYRSANLLSGNLGINALGYLAPALSLMWLYLFGGVDVARWDYLVGGMVLIVGTNLLMSFGPAVRRTGWRHWGMGRSF